MSLLAAAADLRAELAALRFGPPVHSTYNPLDYAWGRHAAYLERYGRGPKRVVFLGMNPGPWGMAQTGIPFGEIPACRDWMGLAGPVGRPDPEHPKRPILGFDCPRSEVSGRRLWGLFAQRFPRPEDFFAGHFVANWCPLVWMGETGANLTPDKLRAAEREPVEQACDRHLVRVLDLLRPEIAIGVGGFATQRIESVRPRLARPPRIGTILHPSPASPAANRGWAEAATRQLEAAGVW